jgi:hypothetical protein
VRATLRNASWTRQCVGQLEHGGMPERDERANAFEEQRSYLFSIAYRLLGSRA